MDEKIRNAIALYLDSPNEQTFSSVCELIDAKRHGLEWGEYKLISSYYHRALEMPCINIYKGERLVGGLSDISPNPYINGVRINHHDLKWQMLELFEQFLTEEK